MDVMMDVLFFLLLIVALPCASAHLEGGEDQMIDGYIVDFGYDPRIPQAGKDLFLNFILVDAKTEHAVDYDGVWVRISDEDVIFAGTLRPVEGSAGMTLRLPRGDYEVKVRFERTDGAPIKTTTRLTVRSWLGAFFARIFEKEERSLDDE